VFRNESFDIAEAVSEDGAIKEMGGGLAGLTPTADSGEADCEEFCGLTLGE
jgi:hypothetical protein